MKTGHSRVVGTVGAFQGSGKKNGGNDVARMSGTSLKSEVCHVGSRPRRETPRGVGGCVGGVNVGRTVGGSTGMFAHESTWKCASPHLSTVHVGASEDRR